MQNSSLAFAKEGSLTPKLNSSKSAVCPGNRPALHFHTDFAWLCSPGYSPLQNLYQPESRLESWTTVLTQVTRIWQPSYPLGGFYENSQVLIFLCCIHVSSTWSPAMSAACCWMPGLLSCVWGLPAAGSARLQITLASAPVTLLFLFLRAQEPLLLKTDCPGARWFLGVWRSSLCIAQTASKCNILVFAMLKKRKISAWTGSFWRERSFLLTHSDKWCTNGHLTASQNPYRVKKWGQTEIPWNKILILEHKY